MVEISPKLAIRLQLELLSTKLACGDGWDISKGACTFFQHRPMPDFSQHLSVEHFPRLTLELTTNPSNIQIYVKGENISIDTSIVLNMSISQIFFNKFLLDSNCFTGISWQWPTSGGDTPDRSYLRHSHPGLAPLPGACLYHVYIYIQCTEDLEDLPIFGAL